MLQVFLTAEDMSLDAHEMTSNRSAMADEDQRNRKRKRANIMKKFWRQPDLYEKRQRCGSWAGCYPENMTHTGALFSETYSARR